MRASLALGGKERLRGHGRESRMYSRGLGPPVTGGEVNPVVCVRVGPFEGPGAAPGGSFPAEGAA